jgi:hypothetical protein
MGSRRETNYEPLMTIPLNPQGGYGADMSIPQMDSRVRLRHTMWRPTDFNRARADLLESLVAELNLPLFKIAQEYNRNPEFKRRGDISALALRANDSSGDIAQP